jgi:SAM-dependent methyltransferase
MKKGEKLYFKKIGEAGVNYSLKKPFSDVAVGSLLHDIAAVFTLFPETPRPLKILDLGCGTGWTSNFYFQAGHKVTGVDISKDAILAAKKHYGKEDDLTFLCSDYDKLSFNETFDVAIFFDSLHHSEDEIDGLSAAYKSLKKGGTLIVCEPGLGHSKNPKSIEAVRKYGVNERDMPPKLSVKKIKEVGFKNIKTYAYPAMIHRALYTNGTSRKTKLLRNNSLFRGLTALLLSTVAKPFHGIVKAIK